MSTQNGSRIAGPIPPHIKKTTNGTPRHRPNKYADMKPSEQKNTSGQRRARRERRWE